MVTIKVTPKLGPYGSPPKYVGVEVLVELSPEDLSMTEVKWNAYRKTLDKAVEIKFNQAGEVVKKI